MRLTNITVFIVYIVYNLLFNIYLLLQTNRTDKHIISFIYKNHSVLHVKNILHTYVLGGTGMQVGKGVVGQ